MSRGEKVFEVRKALNLTMEKFGEKLGVTKAAISNIEKGNRSLTEQMAKAICQEFNVNYDYLINGEGKMFSDVPKATLDELCYQYNCDAEDLTIIVEYLKLNAIRKKVLKDYMRAILEQSSEAASSEQSVSEPEIDIDSMSIDEQVEPSCSELECRKKAREKSEAS